MNPITSTSFASQIYSSIQRTNTSPQAVGGQTNRAEQGGFRLPSSATPRGDWVLSERAEPSEFESGSPRGTYLNVVV